jgi:putative Holliday junction resolvase
MPATDSSELPPSGRLAAIDYGTVRIGIAVCDPDRILASPLEVHPAGDEDTDAEYFRQIARREHLSGFVVGLPIHCDGGESQKSRECRAFACWLHDATGLPVRLFDERFSTAAAKERLGGGISRHKKKRKLDAVAALVLLETFLEACRYHGETVGQAIDQPADGDEALD